MLEITSGMGGGGGIAGISASAHVVLTGFLTGAALIMAIGAQNAFLLRQGLRGEHVLPLVLLCAFSDALLILVGVAGLGWLVERVPQALSVARYGGAAFLFAYGAFALHRASRGAAMDTGDGPRVSLATALGTCLVMTYLNPHLYLDTVVLVGSIANQYPDHGRWLFGAGAILSSIAWFFSLGYGSRLLRPLFARPIAWRLLDLLIAAVMFTMALSLLLPRT